tara:strand:- start:8735 stop:9382 length:648 start_codon:yes stop_codon:yes gene_type:complete
MALEYITQVVKIKGITSTQKLILFCLANYSSEDGYSYPSHEKIAEITCLSRDSVLKNLRTLKDLGLLTWEKRNNTSNLYQLLFDHGYVVENYIGGSPGLHNTKEKQKEIILNLEEISSIYKQKCEKGFFRHETNCFTAENRWKKLKSLIRKGLKSPKTGKHLKLQEKEFWEKYFEIANSEGYRNHVRSWEMSGKPTLRTLLSEKQFNVIIERRYG